LTSSLSAILMFHVFQIESSVSMKMSEFKSLMNLWWSFSFSNRVNDSCELRKRWSTSEVNEVSFWLTWCSTDWVSWWDIDRSTWRCFALKFNRSPCNWLIFFSSSSFLSKATSSCFALFLWSSCMRSQCSLSCRVKSCWLWSSFSILMTLLSWLLIQWNSCSSMFMFHAMTAFSASTEALMSRSETLLLTVLLSRRVIQNSTDSTLHVMMREDKSCWGKNRWEIDVFWIDVFWWVKIQRISCEFQIIIECFIWRISCK